MSPALQELLFKMADDQLILGHRHSEWTGLGPLLEEDIAFSSMAQDKIGHSLALFTMLGRSTGRTPDELAFLRPATEFHNTILCELPNSEFEYALIRQLFYDVQESLRFASLRQSSVHELAELATKIRGELRYHLMHAEILTKRLGTSTEESILRLQTAIDTLYPYALGIFEPSPFEEQLIAEGIFSGEQQLQKEWQAALQQVLQDTELVLPEIATPVMGGRAGTHTPHLTSLLNEMAEVLRLDPTAEW